MNLTRRHAILGIAAAGGALFSTRPASISATRPGTAFGTTVRLSVTANSKSAAERAIDAGFAQIRAVEKTFSLFDPASELSRLNASGRLDQPSPLMRQLVDLSDQLWRQTEGAFDPGVQPLWREWQKSASRGVFPAPEDMATASACVGWQNLIMNKTSIHLAQAGSALTFNGIAQGFAADLVLDALTRNGACSALIDTGEIGMSPEPAEKEPSFAIRHPRDPEQIIGVIRARHGFIDTSGDYATAFSPDFSHHHIFDPALGRSPMELASVTVLAPAGALADGLATAFMVMGVERSMRLCARTKGAEALLVTKAGEISVTPAMAARFLPA
jgi:FAD:protein FMN transferase